MRSVDASPSLQVLCRECSDALAYWQNHVPAHKSAEAFASRCPVDSSQHYLPSALDLEALNPKMLPYPKLHAGNFRQMGAAAEAQAHMALCS